MKRLLIIIAAAVVALIVVGIIAANLFLDKAAKAGIEKVGPKLTKVDVRLDSISLSPLSGSGKIKGLVVGNPEGYKSPSAIRLGTADLALKPSSLMADKLIINRINVQAPELTFETDLKGNNLSKILANIEESMRTTGSEPSVESQDPDAARKLQVDELLVTAGKIHVSVNALGIGKSVTVPLPEIKMQNLGTGPDGITAAALTREVLRVTLDKAVQAASQAASDLAKGALTDTTGVGQKAATDAAAKVTEGLGGLLKKKK